MGQSNAKLHKIEWLEHFHAFGKAARDAATITFRLGNVVKATFLFPELSATVLDRSGEFCKVSVIFNPAGQPISTSCSCEIGPRCQHIATAFLEAASRGFQLPDPPPGGSALSQILAIRPKAGEIRDVEIRLQSRNVAGSPIAEARKLLQPLPLISNKNVEAVSLDRWRLAFEIRYFEPMYGTRASAQWIVTPVLRYLKKRTLEPGRIAKFDAQKLTEDPGTKAREVLRVCEQLGGGAGFFRVMEELLAGDSSLEVVIGEKAHKVRLRETMDLRVTFLLSGFHQRWPEEVYEARWEGKLHGGRGDPTFGEAAALVSDERMVLGFGTDLLALIHDGTLLRMRDSIRLEPIVRAILSRSTNWELSDIKELQRTIRDFNLDTGSFGAKLVVDGSYGTIQVLSPVPQPILAVRGLNVSLGKGSFIDLAFVYGTRRIAFAFFRDHPFLFSQEPATAGSMIYRRRLEFEEEIHDWLISMFTPHLVRRSRSWYDRNDGDFQLALSISEFVETYALNILEQGVEIEIDDRPLKVSRGNFRVNVSSASGWFEFVPTLTTEDGDVVPIPDELNLSPEGMLRSGGRFIRLLPAEIDRLKAYLKQKRLLGSTTPTLRLHGQRFADVEAASDLLDPDVQRDELLSRTLALAASLKKMNAIPRVSPGPGFAGELRPYQQAGLDWLHFIGTHGLNGLLADDMGLGKTIQTIALLSVLKTNAELGRVLVVAPVSTMGNWEREIHRFAPGFTVYVHHGNERSKLDLPEADVCIVSYATLRNDVDLFGSLDIHYLILDEAQTVKNAQSLTFKAVKQLKARRRLSLSGTPVENNTLELWSQMDFLEPGLLGTLKEFKSNFANPIEAKGDKKASEHLRRLVFPFILRRRKADVAKDLPEKEEIIVYVEMEEDQRLFYESVRRHYAELVEKALREQGLANSAIQILEGLLRMRQAALFPALVDATKSKVSSCKFEALKEILSDVGSESQKALLFSQFVQSLSIIREWLDESGFTYCYLDGQSRDRSRVIDRFQNDPEVGLFLLSLKAGGVGINLTAAEYVVLFDPWWNPAVESQAVDRSHRIGQTKKVIVYKLIVKGTIEEKILSLQERKRDLVNQLVTEDAGFYKSLTADDVLRLFEA